MIFFGNGTGWWRWWLQKRAATGSGFSGTYAYDAGNGHGSSNNRWWTPFEVIIFVQRL